ncbi:MAG: hypothetical protein ACI93R_003435 [Flavobacteriales bacterium]|jgi:hypothetical protein
MNWERFTYICRKAKGSLKPDESISECISRVEREPGCGLYGKRIRDDETTRYILNDISNMSDRSEAINTLGIYGEIALSTSLFYMVKFGRIIIYLAYITVILYVLSLIYQVLVIPSFIETMEIFDFPIPSYLVFFRDYWVFFLVIISIFLLCSALIGITLKGVFKFRADSVKGFMFRLYSFREIRSSYFKIIDVLYFPVRTTIDETDSSDMVKHLQAIRRSGMNLSLEIQALVNIEAQVLLKLCEKKMKIITLLTTVVVIAAVVCFLFSAYLPIFYIGDAI